MAKEQAIVVGALLVHQMVLDGGILPLRVWVRHPPRGNVRYSHLVVRIRCDNSDHLSCGDALEHLVLGVVSRQDVDIARLSLANPDDSARSLLG